MALKTLTGSACVAVLLGIVAGGAHGRAQTLPGRNGAIAFVRKDGLYVINPDGSHIRRLVRGSMLSGPSWSPDGRWIVYNCSGRICLVQSNGRGKRQLIRRRVCSPKGDITRNLDPVWSPNGKRIAFEQQCGRSGGVFTAESVTGAANAPAGYCAPGYVGMCTMNPRGRHLRVLLQRARGLAWSPDGRKIAFFPSNSKAHSKLFVAASTGGGRREVVGLCLNDRVDWSPDEKTIAFIPWYFSDEAPFPLLGLVPASGGAYTVLTTNEQSPQSASHPSFSPDGRTIVFQPGEVTGPVGSALWIIGTDGNGLRKLTSPGSDPAWKRLP
jgi:Tol biopolymer transport system component